MSNKINGMRRAALMGSAATLMASFALGQGIATASAQDDDSAADVEEVLVTGSRIKNANISSPSPVTTVGAETIAMRGTTQIEDMLAVLPQTVAAEGDGDFAGSGTALVDLRGLGPNRTLVLVDGHRLPYGQANSTAADLNSIPSALVSRVEILTGGASAVYGADAVAGVVNFIMNRNFEGLQVSGQMSINQADNDSTELLNTLKNAPQGNETPGTPWRGGVSVPDAIFDGFTYSIDAIMGVNSDDGKGNVTLSMNYRESNEILQRNRDFAACPYRSSGTEFVCDGSSNTFPARMANNSLSTGTPFNILAYDKSGGPTRNYNSATDSVNYAFTQRTRSPSERFAVAGFGHYDVGSDSELYMDFGYTSNTSQGQIGPDASFGDITKVNCDNPFLSAGIVDAICTGQGLSGTDIANVTVRRRNVEGGGRQFWNSNDTLRIAGGLRGDFNDSWSYDLHGQFARVKNNSVFQNALGGDNMRKAALVSLVDGVPTCHSVIDGSDPKCVPWNIFQDGGVTDEALAYLGIPQIDIGVVNQKNVSFTLNGDLTDYGIVLPGASTGVQFAGGIEHRTDELILYYDKGQVEESTTGLPHKREEGVTVSEFYGELAIPILEGHEMAEELTATAAFRWSDYNTTGPAQTWALGLTWSPNSDIRFRAQLQQAVRAPSVFELYNRQSWGLFDLSDPDGDGIYDPCASDKLSTDVAQHTPQYSAAECLLQGVSQAQYDAGVTDDQAAQFNSRTGGNPDLDVETSTTYTVGGVITPASIPGLTLSVDYYNITVDDFIGTIPPSLSLKKCSIDKEQDFCNLIQRSPIGSLTGSTRLAGAGHIIATNLNTGSIKTSGVDINLAYGFDLPDGFGTVDLTSITNVMLTHETTPIPGVDESFKCNGFYSGSCNVPRPKYGSTFSTVWTSDNDTNVSLTWRFIGPTILQGSDNTTSPAYQLKAINYFDLAVSASVADNVRLRVGINNILGQRPAITSAGNAGPFTGNSYPGLYDVDMRLLFVSFTADF